ncbi:MAG: helix-turn-helix domain-containing protein [Planctomycetes bacterium]|nr:helix-turn-helix domain-containing protein [Planctomycetota bacterium]
MFAPLLSRDEPTVGDVLNTEDICALFGITKRTLSRWVARPRNPLPVSRPGGRRAYIPRARLLAWLATLEERGPSPPPRRARKAACVGRSA